MPTIVITGASQGIGRAIALHYAASGEDTRLALLARNVQNLDAVAAECFRAGADARVFGCDVTDDEAVVNASGAVLDAWGAPDILINNAGAFVPGLFLETTAKAFRQQIEVNLTSAFLVTRAFLPAMLARGQETNTSGDGSVIPGASGDVVFMASVASTRGYPGGTAYGAAKHGLLGLARTLRAETEDRGLRVMTLLPGATLTPSWDGVEVPKDRLMPPEAIAQAVVAATSLPPEAVVEELLIRPQNGDL